MNRDLQKFAGRKMSLYILIISIWQHDLALKNTIGSMELKELLSDRVKIAADLKEQIDLNSDLTFMYQVDTREDPDGIVLVP